MEEFKDLILKGESGLFNLSITKRDYDRLCTDPILPNMAYKMLARNDDLSSILVGPYLLQVEGDRDTRNASAAKEATGSLSQSVNDVTAGDTDTNKDLNEATGSHCADKVTDEASTEADDKFNWTVETTKLLISLRQEHQAMFNRPSTTKKRVWQIIANKFADKCHSAVDWSQLKGKWAKLERKFKDVKSVNGKSGSGRREFIYEREMEEAIGGNPNITPMATYSSMEDDCVDGKSVSEKSTSLSEKSTSLSEKSTSLSETASKGVKRKRENMYELLSGMRDERKKQHEEKMDIMNKFLDIFSRMVPEKEQ